MRKVEKIVAIVDEDSPGLLDCISCEDGLSKEGLVRKVLGISRGQMVRTHQNPEASGFGRNGRVVLNAPPGGGLGISRPKTNRPAKRRTNKASRHENVPADSKKLCRMTEKE